MEFRQLTTSFRWQWQQTIYLVIAFSTTFVKIQWTYCSGESNWMESSPKRVTRDGWRLSRPAHSFLEHTHAAASTFSGHGFSSVQLDVQSQLLRNCINSRLQSKPSCFVEIPNYEENINPEWSQLQSAVSRYVALWWEHSDGSWRRNFKILEPFPIK